MKKRNFFKENFYLALDYIKSSKNFIYYIIYIFFIFVILGFFIPAPSVIAKQIISFIQNLVSQTQNLSQKEIISFIFLNNTQSALLGLFLGVFLGIFPLINAGINGYLLGFVAAASVKTKGFFILWRIFPHGIFELPAIFISLGLGLKLGSFIFQKRKIESLKNYLINSIRVFLFVVIPFLIVAAIIEGTIIFLFG